jgi:hypothetical protein
MLRYITREGLEELSDISVWRKNGLFEYGFHFIQDGENWNPDDKNTKCIFTFRFTPIEVEKVILFRKINLPKVLIEYIILFFEFSIDLDYPQQQTSEWVKVFVSDVDDVERLTSRSDLMCTKALVYFGNTVNGFNQHEKSDVIQMLRYAFMSTSEVGSHDAE